MLDDLETETSWEPVNLALQRIMEDWDNMLFVVYTGQSPCGCNLNLRQLLHTFQRQSPVWFRSLHEKQSGHESGHTQLYPFLGNKTSALNWEKWSWPQLLSGNGVAKMSPH